MFINPAIESIKVQQNSKLGADMTKLFEDCYAYRKQHYTDIHSVPTVARAISKMIEKRFPKIVLDNTGLDIVKFSFQTDYPTGRIAIDYISNFDLVSVHIIEANASGNIPKVDRNSLPSAYTKRIQHVLDVTKNYDYASGKILKKWPIHLFLDISFLFFLDAYRNTDIKDSMVDTSLAVSPEEITAILLHEIGHAMVFLERANVMYYVAKTVSDNATQFFEKRPNLVDLHRFTKDIIIPMLNKVENSNSTFVDNTAAKFFNTLLKPIMTYLEVCIAKRDGTKPVYDKNYIDTDTIASSRKIFDVQSVLYMNKLELIIGIILSLICKMIVFPFMVMDCFIDEYNGLVDHKSSDIKTTRHNLYLYERLADEYASRHGYGAHIATGLAKLKEFGNEQVDNLVKGGMIHCVLTKVLLAIDNAWPDSHTYERFDQRIRRIVQNTMAILKDKDLDKSFRDSQLKGLESTLKVLDSTGTNVYNKNSFASVKKILTTLVSVDDWIRICTSGRLTQEYETHLNQVEDLMNNFMYAHAAKFRQLFDNMKK